MGKKVWVVLMGWCVLALHNSAALDPRRNLHEAISVDIVHSMKIAGGAFDVVQQRADLAGHCLKSQCHGFRYIFFASAQNSVATVCTNCDFSKDLPQYCQDIKPARNSLVLGSGYFYSGQLLPKNLPLLLEPKWANKDEDLSLDWCSIINYSRRKRIVESKGTANLHTSLLLMISILGDPSVSPGSALNISIIYHPSIDDTSPGRRYHKTIERVVSLSGKMHENLKAGNLVTVIFAYELPWQAINEVPLSNFEIRVKCDGIFNCNMAAYRFCLRFVCNEMSSSQERDLLLVQEELLNPLKLETIPVIPPELLAEAAQTMTSQSSAIP